MRHFTYRIGQGANAVAMTRSANTKSKLIGRFVVGAKTLEIIIDTETLADGVLYSPYAVREIQSLMISFENSNKLISDVGILKAEVFKNKTKLSGTLKLKTTEYHLSLDMFEGYSYLGCEVYPLVLTKKNNPCKLKPEHPAGVLQGAI